MKNNNDDILKDNHHLLNQIKEKNKDNKSQNKLSQNEENESKVLNKFNSLSEPNIIDNNKFNLQDINSENQYIEIIEPITDLNDYYSSLDEKNNSNQNNILTMNDIIGQEMNKEITLDIMKEKFNNFYPGKTSKKSYGCINAYAANTNQGIVRNYNEDRVSINININQPKNYKGETPWPKASFFSVYDGHGGNKCAEFLRDNLLSLICDNAYFPNDVKSAIKFGFDQVDKKFLEQSVKNGKIIETSGSCALILLIVENKIYVANVGDSRCLISMQNGLIRRDVTRDHKPNYPYEKERILANGGNVYQTKTPFNPNNEDGTQSNTDENNDNLILLGPYRVHPGSLSVSRTIGDAAAKLSDFGGNPNVVISEPDIYCYDLEKDDIDFLILGCDGIYDHMTSKDVFKCAWMMIDEYRDYNLQLDEKNKNEGSENNDEKIDTFTTCANIVDFILKASMSRKSFDNVTCVIVSFKDLLNPNNSNNVQKIENNSIYIKDDKENERLPKIVNNINNFVENSQSSKSRNKVNDENTNQKMQKKRIIREKIEIDGLKKEDKKENITFENILNQNKKLKLDKNELPNQKKITNSGENTQRSKNYKIFSEFELYNDKNNPKNVSLSSKKFKDNIIINNTFSNSEKDMISNKVLSLDNNIRNDSKEKKLIHKRKHLFLKSKIKPLFIDKQKSNFLKSTNKMKNYYNLELKLVTNNNTNHKKNDQEVGTMTKTISQGGDINFFKNKKEKESLFINDEMPKITNINTIEPNNKNKFKLKLNNLMPFRNKNNLGFNFINLSKKSISFYNNTFLNNFNSNHDRNSKLKNPKSPPSNYNLINFNRINRINLHFGINNTLNNKYKFSSEDRHDLKNKKQIKINPINKDFNIYNSIMNKYNQTQTMNHKKTGKKLVHNLTEDILSEKNKLMDDNNDLKTKASNGNKKKKLYVE